ncbi:MAG: RNA-processing protein [Candidatus Aenigmarchaeota archaeon]|nr:RNA-processing protein [Candidatus Aenigmarchaeota archaeon]
MIKTIRIPEDRVKVLKSCLKILKSKTKTDISIEENLIKISGEPLDIWRTNNIIKAIGRGFSPVNSFKLLDEDNSLEIIELKKYLKTQKSIKRIKGRIIGKEGKTRKIIEDSTGSVVSVYGNTVSIISSYEEIHKATEAIMMLINGSSHRKVYKYLERREFNEKGR